MAKMKLVYICSPFRDDDKLKQYANARAAQHYCRDAYEKNCIPVAPHLYLPQFLDDDIPEERDLALRIGLRLINYCSEVWVHGDRISDGMRGEIEYASSTGKPVIYIDAAEEEPERVSKDIRNMPDDKRSRDLASMSDDERSRELTRMYHNGDPRYASELRKWAEEVCEAADREIAEKGPIEDLIDEDAAVEDLY